ncbi:MAG: hypothetical protein L6R39_006705 [Caloplaca ligustica]|nr:MAG: hypothetical protein L6R39_006705 [Caloplaca ligustica]
MGPKGFNDHAVRAKLQQDRKRELDQRHKWALGEAAPTSGRNKRQPARNPRPVFARAVSREVRFSKNKATRMERASCKHGGPYNDDSPISDSGEDVREASAAPEPDAGITYSYDAAHGPHKGGQILSMALAKAVEKYEIQATEKLVMTEYEVVGEEKDEASTGYAADDSDFELI